MKREALKRASLPELSALYAEAATVHGEASGEGQNRVAHAQYKRLVATWKELRDRGEEGRAVLLGLLGHTEPYVRCWAATHVLEFDPPTAEAELERLAALPGVAGLHAQVTLEHWRAGSLKF